MITRENQDPEYMKFLNETIDRTDITWEKKLDLIIEMKKKKFGLIGMHPSILPIDPNKPQPTVEGVAHDMCLMIQEFDSGNCREITGEELEKF